MKKLFIIMGLAIVGCQSPQTLIVKSNFTAVNHDSTKLWIRDTDFGKCLYDSWKSGTYGTKTEVYLVDSVGFEILVGTRQKVKTSTVSL